MKKIFYSIRDFWIYVFLVLIFGFITMTLFAGFIGTYYLQKNNYNSVFRDTKKFTAQFKYQINSKQNSINPHYWLDFVPLYSGIKFKDEKVNSYNLTFGNINQYQKQISQLSREYPHQKELIKLLPFFDLSSSFNNIGDDKCVAFINQITSVYKSNNKWYYSPITNIDNQKIIALFNEKKYNDYLKQYLNGLDTSITFQSSLLFRTKPPGMSYWDFFRTERKKIFFKRLIYFLKKAILSQVNDIFKNVVALPGFADSNSLSDLNDFIHQQGFPFYFHEGATATRVTVAKNFDYLYQLIFGQSYQGMSQTNLFAKYNRTFNLQVDTRHVQKDTVLSTSNSKINYFQTGLRGLVNPVLQESRKFAFPATRLRYYTTHWYDFNQKIFPRHLWYIQQATNTHFLVRRESYYRNYLSGKEYRIVYLDNFTPGKWPLKVTAGRRPTFFYEILLSQGFAQKNHIKIGTWINLNGRYAHVVGYGVDPLSFLPNVVGSSGLPDYLHQGIIYGSALLFQDIVANNKNFVFVYNNRNSNNANLLINNIRGCMLNNGAYLVDTINYLTKNTPIVEKSDVAFELKLTSFNKSFFRFNWQVFHLLQVTFFGIMFFLLGIILFIIVLSSWLVAAKITREQQKQIATLKAFGWKTSAIVWRYTSWVWVLVPFNLLLAMVLGGIMPWLFNQFFNQFFIINWYGIFFSWWYLLMIAIILLTILLPMFLNFYRFFRINSTVVLLNKDLSLFKK